MKNSFYPEGVDLVWLASDQEDRVGAFITAGCGPIPLPALRTGHLLLEDVEPTVGKMSEISEVRLLVSVKRPDDFVGLGKRGFFVFDWTDIYRKKADLIDAYEPVAIPSNPIRLDMLARGLMETCTSLRLAGVSFADLAPLKIHRLVECASPQ